MSEPIVVTNGQHEIKIYTVQNRGRAVFQLSYYEGGHRQRKTFAKLSAARREAKIALGKLALATQDAGEITTADMESFALARKHVAETKLPLHVCAELFAKAHAVLGGRPLLDAVNFFVSYHPAGAVPKSMSELIESFAEARSAMGVAADYVADIRRQLGRLAQTYLGRPLVELRTSDLDRWLSSRSCSPITKNNVRKILITFGNWCKANGHLPDNRPTEFDGMISYKVPPSKVAIYTPEELQKVMKAVAVKRPELLPWVACAAFTGARVSELDLLDWSHINFERGFVEVASKKVRTKARRLVPLHDALRVWLAPHRQASGPINVYAAPQAAFARIAADAGVTIKDNGFRHSYISYRLATINDTARVALEAGNSPEVIFAHYRELVGPDEATAWFGSPRVTLAKAESGAVKAA